MELYQGMKFRVNKASKRSHLTVGHIYEIDIAYGSSFLFRCDVGPGHTGTLASFKKGTFSVVHKELNQSTKTL